MRAPGAARQADDRAARIRVPVRRAQAGERRDDVDAPVVGDACRERLNLDRRAEEAHLVAQPLHDRPGDEHAAFEGVLFFRVARIACAPQLGSSGGQQAILRSHQLVAGVQQHEATGAVGVLRHSGAVAALAEERRLLVAGDSGYGDRRAEQFGRGHTERVRRRIHIGQDRARHAQDLEQLVVPVAGADVEQQRARGVRRIGDVRAALREIPRDPCVDRAERELSALGADARARNVVEQPRELRAREIRVEHEAGLRAHRFLGARRAQLGALRRGATVLPHDRVVERLTGLPIPQHSGLALVGDADRADLLWLDAGLLDRLARGVALRDPDFLRIVLDPAGLREDLAEFALRNGARRAFFVEDDGARAGRALIERQDEAHAGIVAFPSERRRAAGVTIRAVRRRKSRA